jgi:hypothetical protein
LLSDGGRSWSWALERAEHNAGEWQAQRRQCDKQPGPAAPAFT